MDFALIEAGKVVNLIWLHPDNAVDFPGAVPLGDIPAQIGDEYDGQQFLRNGQRVQSLLEEARDTIAQLDAALLEVQYQQLIGGYEA